MPSKLPELFRDLLEAHRLALGETRSFEDGIPDDLAPYLNQLSESGEAKYIDDLKEYLAACIPNFQYEVGSLILNSAAEIHAMHQKDGEGAKLSLGLGFFVIGSREGYLVAYSTHDNGVYQFTSPFHLSPTPTAEELSKEFPRQYQDLKDLAKQGIQKFEDERSESTN